jgi:hypothetical protein
VSYKTWRIISASCLYSACLPSIMPPNYGAQGFWDARFKKEIHFEWLNDGAPIIRRIQDYLKNRANSDDLVVHPQTLHIGAGTSTLHEQILHVYKELFPEFKDVAVVNTDFSAGAVAKGMALQQYRSGPISVWEVSDILKWSHVKSLAKIYGAGDARLQVFELVVDKSTSDAISCNEDIEFGHVDEPELHPCLTRLIPETSSVDPLQVLALHLAAIVKPKGVWIILSYSSNRFPFLAGGGTGEGEADVVHADRWWEVEMVESVEAPSAAGKDGVHVPTVMHHLYVLRRTDTVA